MICVICDTEPRWAWCDHHGIAQCVTCGAPYRLIHYDGEGSERKRVERAPDLLLEVADIEAVRRCRSETGAKLSAVGLGLSFPGGYDVASRADVDAFSEWWAKHKPPTAAEEPR